MKPNERKNKEGEISRREVIKLSAMGIALAALGGFPNRVEAQALSGKAYLGSRYEIVIGICEWLIPSSKSGPSAVEVGVPQYIDLLCREYEPLEDVALVESGLDRLDAACRERKGTSFIKSNVQDRKEFLDTWFKNPEGPDRAFVRKMRSLVLNGYYTSERVAKEVLVYDPIPGRYEGCVPLEITGGKTWAL